MVKFKGVKLIIGAAALAVSAGAMAHRHHEHHVYSYDQNSGGYCDTGGRTVEAPEPGALALLGIGLVGMAVARRRDKR